MKRMVRIDPIGDKPTVWVNPDRIVSIQSHKKTATVTTTHVMGDRFFYETLEPAPSLADDVADACGWGSR
jgi:hypothetical protein